jgi:hypothetical protein
MPIRRYVEEGVFTPQALSAMNRALEATTEILGMGATKQNVKRSQGSSFGLRGRTTASMRPNCVIRPWRRGAASHTWRLLWPLSPKIPAQAQIERRLRAAQVPR